jgi:hypothetical protein
VRAARSVSCSQVADQWIEVSRSMLSRNASTAARNNESDDQNRRSRRQLLNYLPPPISKRTKTLWSDTAHRTFRDLPGYSNSRFKTRPWRPCLSSSQRRLGSSSFWCFGDSKETGMISHSAVVKRAQPALSSFTTAKLVNDEPEVSAIRV